MATESTWRKDMRPASFRGVKFEVANRDYAGGRRLATHEYPKRDEPTNEDMGRKARQLSVEAFQFGREYLGPRNSLLEALEKDGPGEYVDPWGLSHTVRVRQFSASERLDMGGYVAWRLDFVEDTEGGGHTTRTDTAALASGAADDAEDAYVDDFADRFGVIGPDLVRSEALEQAEGWMDRAGSVSWGTPAAARSLLNLRRQSTSLMDKPGSLADGIRSTISSLVGGVSTGGSGGNSRYTAARELATMAPERPLVTSSSSQATANQAALSDLTSGLAVVQAARATTDMDFEVYEDAVAVRQQVAADLDEAMATASDPLYEALHALRTAVVRDIAVRGADLARLDDLTPGATLPALVVAYAYYGNAARETDVLSRNPVIRHPGFVPGGNTLKVVRDE